MYIIPQARGPSKSNEGNIIRISSPKEVFEFQKREKKSKPATMYNSNRIGAQPQILNHAPYAR